MDVKSNIALKCRWQDANLQQLSRKSKKNKKENKNAVTVTNTVQVYKYSTGLQIQYRFTNTVQVYKYSTIKVQVCLETCICTPTNVFCDCCLILHFDTKTLFPLPVDEFVCSTSLYVRRRERNGKQAPGRKVAWRPPTLLQWLFFFFLRFQTWIVPQKGRELTCPPGCHVSLWTEANKYRRLSILPFRDENKSQVMVGVRASALATVSYGNVCILCVSRDCQGSARVNACCCPPPLPALTWRGWIRACVTDLQW